MPVRGQNLLLAAVVTSLASIFSAPALAWDLRLSDNEARLCDDDVVLRKIEKRFRHQIKHVPELPEVEIGEISRIHQHRYYPASESSPIARRYCHGTARLSDGRSRKIWYLIEDGQGFAGVGDNVEFCVSGFDRWNVYNSYCRILR